MSDELHVAPSEMLMAIESLQKALQAVEVLTVGDDAALRGAAVIAITDDAGRWKGWKIVGPSSEPMWQGEFLPTPGLEGLSWMAGWCSQFETLEALRGRRGG